MRLTLAALMLAVVAPLPALAQAAPNALEQAASAKAEREKDLAEIKAMMDKAAATRARIEQDIGAIRSDRERLVQESIAVAARIRSMEDMVAATETRLTTLNGEDAKLRASLAARRHIIADVLAALQRMGRRPPPALLVESTDFLKGLRSAILLAAVVPDLREAAAVLMVDLDKLDRVRHDMLRERDRLASEKTAIEQDRLRIEALAEARREQLAESERLSVEEKLRSAGLARQASDLQGLIGRMDTEITAAQQAEEAARVSTQAKQGGFSDKRIAMAALGNPGRLEPGIAFADAKGRVPLPVNGVKIREQGLGEGAGAREHGLHLMTRPQAQVTSPADGWVVYSGPFRTYGHVLILNVGGKHLILLAGMERASVDIGQFVLSGEPVGTMGQTASQAVAVMTGRNEPVLYIEFRKDGAAVDSTPWWASQPSPEPDDQKARG